jgi:hypothetical protein
VRGSLALVFTSVSEFGLVQFFQVCHVAGPPRRSMYRSRSAGGLSIGLSLLAISG